MFNFGIPRAHLLETSVCVGAISQKFFQGVKPCDLQTGQQIRELCIIRDKLCFESFLLSRHEICIILENLCVD